MVPACILASSIDPAHLGHGMTLRDCGGVVGSVLHLVPCRHVGGDSLEEAAVQSPAEYVRENQELWRMLEASVADGFSAIIMTRPADPLGWRQKRRHQRPLPITQIACIPAAPPLILTASGFGPGHRDPRFVSLTNRITTY